MTGRGSGDIPCRRGTSGGSLPSDQSGIIGLDCRLGLCSPSAGGKRSSEDNRWNPNRVTVGDETHGGSGVEAPPATACSRPGFNGAHYYVEVDPATHEPAASTGYLRCRWCGAAYHACLVPTGGSSTRVVREISATEAFRPVREATW